MVEQLKKFRIISGIILIITGIIVLLGWQFDIPLFKSIFPGYVTMKPVTALCFILSGIFLTLKNKAKSSFSIKLFIQICSLIIILTGLLVLLEFIFKINLHIGDLFFKEKLLTFEKKDINHISPIAGFNFSLLGLVLLMTTFGNKYFKLNQIFSIVLITTSVFAFSNIYGDEDFYGIINNSKMAIHSSFAFILIAVSIISIDSDKGLFYLYKSKTTGGILARKIIPFIIILPIFLSWLKTQQNNYGLFSALFGVILFCAALMFSYRLMQSELKKEEFERKLILHAKTLEQNNIQLNDFCNIVSHNLRAPFVNISMLVDFVEKSKDDEERKEIIGKFKPVLSNINETFNELMESIQIKNDIQSKYDRIDLRECLEKIINGFEIEIIKTKAQFEIDLNDAPIIEYPKKYIDSILFNLISNSLKYKSPNRDPKIIIKTENKKEAILFSISDNGLGIDLNKHKDNIFKIRKVFHEHPDSKGFGLFMTKNQVEATGSKIWIESTPNVGTTFFIEFNKSQIPHEYS
jgi:signal transduction histidine kinase